MDRELYTVGEDTELAGLKGAWKGIAYLTSALCMDEDKSHYTCCAENAFDPWRLEVWMNISMFQSSYLCSFRYISLLRATLFDNASFIFQPHMAWQTDVLRLKRVETSLVFLMSDDARSSSYCMFLHLDRLPESSDTLVISLHVTGTTRENQWVKENCGELVTVNTSATSCEPEGPRPRLGETSNGWWGVSSMKLVRQATPAYTLGRLEPSRNSFDALVVVIVVSLGFIAGLIVVVVMCFLIRHRSRGMKAKWSLKQSEDPIELGVPHQPAPQIDGYPVFDIDTEQSSQMWQDRKSMSMLSSTWGVPEVFHRGIEEHWFYSDSEVELETNIVASGSFGDVRKGKLLGSTAIAFKTCLESTGSDNELSALVNEIRLLRRVRHPHVVLFFGVSYLFNTRSIGILLEWIDGMNLKQYSQELSPSGDYDVESTHSGAGTALSWLHIAKLFQDVRSGMQFLHLQKPPIVHRDLKPSNILVEMIATPPRAKITDLGLSVLQSEVSSRGRAGTKGFVAPEVLAGGACTTRSDIYSYGCTIAYVLSRLNNNVSLALQALKAPALTSEAVKKCLRTESDRRPSFAELEKPFDAWLGAIKVVSWHSDRADSSQDNSISALINL